MSMNFECSVPTSGLCPSKSTLKHIHSAEKDLDAQYQVSHKLPEQVY